MDHGFELQMVQQAYRFALAPTPRQERQFLSHAGGARFAFNWGVAQVAKALDQREIERSMAGEPITPIPDHFALCKQWTEWKNTAEWVVDRETGETTIGVPWVTNNFTGTYQAALRDAAVAWGNFLSSRSGVRAGRAVGRPKFKSKAKSTPAFQLHGPSLRMESATRVNLPKIGEVVVMSDDDRHPAMSRSRRRQPGQRHMGNRRRSRQIFRQLQQANERAVTASKIMQAGRGGMPLDDAVEALNRIVDERAAAVAVGKAVARLEAAEKALAEAALEPDKTLARLRKRVEQAQAALEKTTREAPHRQAPRTERWTIRKLEEIEGSGRVSVQQAEDLAVVYGLEVDQRVLLRNAAFQARVVRGTVTQGADGLWWLSLTCWVPVEVRKRPTRRQLENEFVGVDLGVRDLAQLSKRPGRIRNPRYLEKALRELRAAQQQLSRCEKDSKRRAKARARVGLIHADVARLRDAAAHRASTRLARRFQGIAVEGWNIQDMMRGGSADLPKSLRKRRNRAMADAAIGTLRWQLGYKTSRSGASLTVTGPGEPTGRTCAVCGHARAKPVPPHHEVFTCESCGRSAPRRLNTARVLERVAAGSGSPDGGSADSRGGGVSPESVRREPGGGGQPSSNRDARSRPPGRGQTGTPDP